MYKLDDIDYLIIKDGVNILYLLKKNKLKMKINILECV